MQIKIISVLIFFVLNLSVLYSQTVISASNEIVLPRYAVNGNTTGSRMMYVCMLKLTGLTANTTYRYVTGASTNSGVTTSTAAGNHIGISNSSGTAGYIEGYTAGKTSLINLLGNNSWNTSSSANNYSQFTTNLQGEYTGWFSFVPTGNSAFSAGNNIYIYVQINNGAGGTAITSSFRTTNTVAMLAYGTNSGNSTQCTAIYGNSGIPDENFVYLFSDTSGTGRPVSVTWTENDGLAQDWTIWYNSFVSTNSGYWGTTIPNNLPNGIRRIERRNISNTLLNYITDNDGIWLSGVNTVNPSGGTTPINLSDATLPVKLTSSGLSVNGNSINVFWKTISEINNKGFEIYRHKDSIWKQIGFVKGKGNTNETVLYKFVDKDLQPGKYFYRLKQIDYNGNYEIFEIDEDADIKSPTKDFLYGNFPNPFNPFTKIKYQISKPGFVKLNIYDVSGRLLETIVNDNLKEGIYETEFNGSKYSSGIYFYKLFTTYLFETGKMILVK